MEAATKAAMPAVSFDTSPDRYRHWKLTFDGPIATLAMDVDQDAGLSPDYKLKLNSYDLGVDVELADAIQRLRFEHPEVRAVVVTSLKERIFCAGANIFMLRGSTHAWKVNFCKFTNETRLAMEDASRHSGIKFLAALNGICAGGGYELALACDEIILVDDGNSAVSLPETPLLGVLPGTGGLTRVVDKRKVRRDLADVFGTVAEGVKGKRAVEWRLVDAVYPTSQFKQRVGPGPGAGRQVRSPGHGPGITLTPLKPKVTENAITYSAVTSKSTARSASATLTVSGPSGAALHAGEIRRSAISSGRCARSASWTTRCCGCARRAAHRHDRRQDARRPGRDAGDRRAAAGAPGSLAGARDHPLHEAHAEADGPDVAQLLRLHRAGQLLRRLAVRARARRRPSYMLDDPDSRQRHRAVGR
jgi:benzoyl-CoA-dihydrodiol lyase